MEKSQVIAALRAWVKQRPGLEFGNYGDISAYRSELRGITKDRHQAETMLHAIEWNDSITGEMIVEAAKHAYSGRLSIEQRPDGKLAIDYCTGQYWPTEYRRAVCAVLSSVLWAHWREEAHNAQNIDKREHASLGDELRAKARDELGASIAKRWFN